MIKLPAYFTGFSSKADGSASLRFTTQEIKPEEFAEFQRTLNTFGWLLFRENDFSIEDMPKEDADEDVKSPSKRLRAVIYILSQQQGVPKEKFENFYRQWMEKIIDFAKGKIDQ